jgi:hypothetical protein
VVRQNTPSDTSLLHGLFSQVKGNLGFLGLTVDLNADPPGPTLTGGT